MKKKLIIALAVFAVVVVAACAARAYVDGRESERLAAEAQAEAQAAAEGQAAQEEAEEAEEAEASPTLEESLRASYDAQESEVAAILASDTWVESGGSGTLTFTTETMTEAKDGFRTASSDFAIAAIEYATEGSEDGGYSETYTIAASADEEIFIMELSRFHPASGAEQSWSLYSSSFSYAYTYYSSSSLTGVEVVGITDELAELIGGEANRDRLVSMIQDRALSSYPTARTATWDGVIETDEEQGIVIMRFLLDNAAGSVIQALHVLGTDGLELESE